MSLYSIHGAAHTQDTDKSTTEDMQTIENEACYGKMMRCTTEPEKLNMENSGS